MRIRIRNTGDKTDQGGQKKCYEKEMNEKIKDEIQEKKKWQKGVMTDRNST